MNVRIAALALLVVAAPAGGHDFWIQPDNFAIDPGSPVSFTFQVGHGKGRERWNNHQRIVALNDFSRGSRRDLRPQLRKGAQFDLAITGMMPGLHIVALQSTHAMSELPAIRFNDYAREEGLVPILAARKAAGTSNRPGREKYSRRAKALVQIGPPTAASQAFATRPIGLKLEIVPDRHPLALGPDRILPLHVLYNGRRLPNATVKLTNLGADERPVAVAVTDRTGRTRFRVPATGTWLLNVVWSEAVRNDPKVDFDTIFSSLTFGDERKPRRR